MSLDDCGSTYGEGYEEAIDDVLEIIKKNPIFPPSQSQKLFLKIKKLKEDSIV